MEDISSQADNLEPLVLFVL